MTPVMNPAKATLSQAPQALAGHFAAYELKLLSHWISAGLPGPVADYAEDGLDLNHYLVQNKPATFMFTVNGDSMLGAGICDGDKVVVDKALLEVYSIDESFLQIETVLKRYQNTSELGQKIKQEVKGTTGLPVCVGIGSSKTLAKLVNHLTKKTPTVCWRMRCKRAGKRRALSVDK